MKLNVIGLGPGDIEYLAPKARKALEESDIITGYTVYIDLVRSFFSEKVYVDSPMRMETARCKAAVLEALRGKTVSLICSGDAGIYGMAGLVYEILDEYGNPELEIEIIPGITAANGGAAVLGAPIGHDFAVISLSDLLTPREVIAKRLEAAGMGDFAICLYNPSSKKRGDMLRWACDILLPYRDAKTVCGCVRNIARDGQTAEIMTLAALRDYKADMFTTVYIGNSQTREVNGKMVTPRGYDISK